HARRIPAVLAADPDLPVLADSSTLLDAGAHELADALAVQGMERIEGEDPRSTKSRRNLPSASSRLYPNVVCVRSFVPKEKNSACRASASAASAAGRSSIMVPNL